MTDVADEDRPRLPASVGAHRLSTIRHGFLLALEAAGRAPATLKWHRVKLERLLRFLGDVPATSVTAEMVRAFLVAVKGTGNSGVYVEDFRKSVSALFAWAVREGYLASSPVALVRPVKIDRHDPVILSEEEVARLLAACDRASYEGARNHVILATLYDTALRVGELTRLEAADLDLDQGTLRVRSSKSRRERSVPVSASLRALLFTYLTRWRPAEAQGLFVARVGTPLLPNAVYQMVRRAARRAGIAKRVYPHLLRHTAATHYLLNGGDQFSLRELLGHASLEMSARYVHLAGARDLAKRHAGASPLEHLARTAYTSGRGADGQRV